MSHNTGQSRMQSTVKTSSGSVYMVSVYAITGTRAIRRLYFGRNQEYREICRNENPGSSGICD